MKKNSKQGLVPLSETFQRRTDNHYWAFLSSKQSSGD